MSTRPGNSGCPGNVLNIILSWNVSWNMYFWGFCPENILTFFAETVFKLVFDLIITIAYIYFLLSDHFLCLLFRLAGDHLYVVSINFMVSLQNCASNLRKSIIPTKILLKSAKKSLI